MPEYSQSKIDNRQSPVTGTESPDEARYRSSRVWILAMLCGISAVSFFERVCVSILSPLIMEDLKLDQPRMGQVFSAFLLGYAGCQYPSGSLADRFGTRRVLGWAMLAWGSLTVATAFVQHPFVANWVGGFTALLMIRFLLGVTEAPTYPGSNRVVSTWFRGVEQGRATSIFGVGMGIGSAIAPPVVARLMLAWGWKKALYVISAPAFLMALLWARKGGEGPSRVAKTGLPASACLDNSLFRHKEVWLLTISYFLNNYVSYVFVFWFFPYLVQVRHFNILESSWMATAPWILTIIMTPLGGGISDWLVRRIGENWGRRALPLSGMVLAGLLLYLGAKEQNPYLAVAELTLCEGLMMLVDPVFWASAIEIAPDSAGRSGGFMNMGGNLGGLVSASLTPLVAAQIGWVGSLNFTAVVTVVGGLMWFWIDPWKTSRDSEQVPA